MSRSYDTTAALRDSIESIVGEDFQDSGYDLNDVEGTITLTARVSVILPDGWDFSSYNDYLEIERQISL